VIPAHNAAETLGEQLDALLAQHCPAPWEVVVVDNGSTDATAEVVRAAAADPPVPVRLVRAEDGHGPAYARNVGAAAALGARLAFCDADDVVGPAWVGAVADALDREAFVCGPIELARLNPAWLAASRGSTGTAAAARFEGRFPFASSCNLGVRRDRFEAVGGFDESLTVGEDIDLSMRLHLAGVDLVFVPDALVHYRYRPTLGDTFRRAVAYGASMPVVAERWRARTGEQLPRAAHARSWLWLVRHVALLADRPGRARWLWVAGQRVGTVRGAIAARRVYV
jgi:glycosyltransferase involved in cell wall biosynthesis